MDVRGEGAWGGGGVGTSEGPTLGEYTIPGGEHYNNLGKGNWKVIRQLIEYVLLEHYKITSNLVRLLAAEQITGIQNQFEMV